MSNLKKFLKQGSIAVPIIFLNHISLASQTIVMECELIEDYTFYNETVYPSLVDEKISPKIERYTVTIVDDNRAFIGNMKNCAFKGPRLVCRQDEEFKDVVKNKKRKQHEYIYDLNRENGEFSYYDNLDILVSSSGGEGWSLIRTLKSGEGYCKKIEQEKLF